MAVIRTASQSGQRSAIPYIVLGTLLLVLGLAFMTMRVGVAWKSGTARRDTAAAAAAVAAAGWRGRY